MYVCINMDSKTVCCTINLPFNPNHRNILSGKNSGGTVTLRAPCIQAVAVASYSHFPTLQKI